MQHTLSETAAIKILSKEEGPVWIIITHYNAVGAVYISDNEETAILGSAIVLQFNQVISALWHGDLWARSDGSSAFMTLVVLKSRQYLPILEGVRP